MPIWVYVKQCSHAGAEIVRAPAGADDGGYAASFADPYGNLWQLTSRSR